MDISTIIGAERDLDFAGRDSIVQIMMTRTDNDEIPGWRPDSDE